MKTRQQAREQLFVERESSACGFKIGKFQAGTRIMYTGDAANSPSEGTIISYNPPTKYRYAGVTIKFDDERFDGDTKISRHVLLIVFKPLPGRRFWLLEDYLEDRRAKVRSIGIEPQF